LKTASSKWIKSKDARLTNFYWQSGYAAFSVSQSDADKVVYIADQAEHHRKRTFQEEYRLLLEKYQVAFDERYVWD
jgi:putative transposase